MCFLSMMIDKVDIVFNYGGHWVLLPQLLYSGSLVDKWTNFNPDLLSVRDITEEFINLGLNEVKQLLV